jgi:hypothetical protein
MEDGKQSGSRSKVSPRVGAYPMRWVARFVVSLNSLYLLCHFVPGQVPLSRFG